MGVLELIQNALKGRGSDTRKGPSQKCPSCGEKVTLDMERCPKCGVRIKSMFRRQCPQCQTLNSLDEKRCTNCKYDFEAELERAQRTYYVCPICSFKSEAFLTRCPACNTRFV